ncbi:MAG: IS1595 family transposase [Candidatus Dormiibacterota bacterium]
MPKVDRKNPVRAKSSESSYSLMEFNRLYPDDDACMEFLWRTRYSEDGKHANCPKCEVVREFKHYKTAEKRNAWTCVACGRHLHPTAGTIFHKSATSLHLWFYAMYVMTSTRCGISAKQLERELGVTYKTAWRMFTLIRNQLMVQTNEPMTGQVEMDEMYVGGRPRLGDVRSFQDAALWAEQKAKVFGMVERGGKVAAYVVPSVQTPTLMAHVKARVLPEAVIYTDEARQYQYGIKRAGYQHRRIHHAAHVYVQGDIHTQTIEGFWSLVKRGIGGTHHAVSAKYLQGYLNEYAWRYNHRKDLRSQFDTLLLKAAEPE